MICEEVLPKGKKYTQKCFMLLRLLTSKVNGLLDDATNKMVNELIHNYKIKLNDLQGALRREKFTITVGDELPVYIAKKRKLKVRGWLDVTVTKVLLLVSFVMKICLSLKTGHCVEPIGYLHV
jgi:hypothetical protein